tara:strand:- start:20 stop:643 length:624 start_codon:yes stop_codon:yes gene_type:complete
MKLKQFLNLLKEVIGDSFKYVGKLFILSILFNLIFCIDEEKIAQDDYISSSHSLCKGICVDFYLKEKPYIGMNFKLSHNFLFSVKTSLVNSINEQIYSHNLYGFDLDLLNNRKRNIILSFDINKSFYHDDSVYSWQQISLIYLKKNTRGNFQVILDSNYDSSWSGNQINLIYGIKMYKNIFFSIGLIKNFSNLSNDYNGFLALNFNI